MTSRDEYRAKITDDNGIARGKIPAPLVRDLGAEPGDYMIFNVDKSGRVTMSLARSRGRGRKSASPKKAAKRATAKRR